MEPLKHEADLVQPVARLVARRQLRHVFAEQPQLAGVGAQDAAQNRQQR